MHPEAMKWLVSHSHTDPVPALEIGARNINGNARALWPCARWITVDLREGPDVEIVADATSTEFPNLVLDYAYGAGDALSHGEHFGLVLCTEVLEHVKASEDLMENVVELLRPTGVLLLTCATYGREPHSDIDGGPLRPGEHYENIDTAWVVAQLDGCQEWTLTRNHTDLYLRAVK